MSEHPMYIAMARECKMIQSEVRRKHITGQSEYSYQTSYL